VCSCCGVRWRRGYDAVSLVEITTLDSVLAHIQPDLLTLDLCMPKMDGIEALPGISRRLQKGVQAISHHQRDRTVFCASSEDLALNYA